MTSDTATDPGSKRERLGPEPLSPAVAPCAARPPGGGRTPLEKDVRAFAEALRTLPRPVYAFCRSGGRSAALWALASVAAMTTETLIETCVKAGHDISFLAAKIDMRRE